MLLLFECYFTSENVLEDINQNYKEETESGHNSFPHLLCSQEQEWESMMGHSG